MDTKEIKVPQTDEEVIAHLREIITDKEFCLSAILKYECRRVLGDSVETAYEKTLLRILGREE